MSRWSECLLTSNIANDVIGLGSVKRTLAVVNEAVCGLRPQVSESWLRDLGSSDLNLKIVRN